MDANVSLLTPNPNNVGAPGPGSTERRDVEELTQERQFNKEWKVATSQEPIHTKNGMVYGRLFKAAEDGAITRKEYKEATSHGFTESAWLAFTSGNDCFLGKDAASCMDDLISSLEHFNNVSDAFSALGKRLYYFSFMRTSKVNLITPKTGAGMKSIWQGLDQNKKTDFVWNNYQSLSQLCYKVNSQRDEQAEQIGKDVFHHKETDQNLKDRVAWLIKFLENASDKEWAIIMSGLSQEYEDDFRRVGADISQLDLGDPLVAQMYMREMLMPQASGDKDSDVKTAFKNVRAFARRVKKLGVNAEKDIKGIDLNAKGVFDQVKDIINDKTLSTPALNASLKALLKSHPLPEEPQLKGAPAA